MKKVLLGILFLVFLTSCGSSSQNVVSKFIDNLKAGKTSEAGKYVLDENFESNFSKTYQNKDQELLFQALLKNINYKVIKTEKQGEDTNIITVEVENIDTKKLFLQMFKNMIGNSFSKENSDKKTETTFKEMLESKDLPKIKNTTKFVVKKSGDTEKIVLTGENLDILLGKINTTFQNLEKYLEETEIEKNQQQSENND